MLSLRISTMQWVDATRTIVAVFLLLFVIIPVLLYVYARVAGWGWWRSKADGDKAVYEAFIKNTNSDQEDDNGKR